MSQGYCCVRGGDENAQMKYFTFRSGDRTALKVYLVRLYSCEKCKRSSHTFYITRGRLICIWCVRKFDSKLIKRRAESEG